MKFHKKSVIFFSVIFFATQSFSISALPSTKWVKKNILDFSPLSFFIDIKEQEKWDYLKGSYKGKLLHIGARSCRSIVPTVGSKVKKGLRGTAETILGKKSRWGVGPAKVSGKTVAYYGVNGTWSIVFAKGTLEQKVLYTLYKLLIKKPSSRYISKKFLTLTALLGINNRLECTARWWVGKDGYCKVFADVAKKAVKSTFDLLVDECVGCYIIPKIYS